MAKRRSRSSKAKTRARRVPVQTVSRATRRSRIRTAARRQPSLGRDLSLAKLPRIREVAQRETVQRSHVIRRPKQWQKEVKNLTSIGVARQTTPPGRRRPKLYAPVARELRQLVCSRRKERREVLMAIGDVNRSGGAPGRNNTYNRKWSNVQCHGAR